MSDVADRPDPLAVLREGLHVLYAYTSDAANPPGRGRSETHAECRAALAQLEALVEVAHEIASYDAARERHGVYALVRWDEIADIAKALAPFPRKEQT